MNPPYKWVYVDEFDWNLNQRLKFVRTLDTLVNVRSSGFAPGHTRRSDKYEHIFPSTFNTKKIPNQSQTTEKQPLRSIIPYFYGCPFFVPRALVRAGECRHFSKLRRFLAFCSPRVWDPAVGDCGRSKVTIFILSSSFSEEHRASSSVRSGPAGCQGVCCSNKNRSTNGCCCCSRGSLCRAWSGLKSNSRINRSPAQAQKYK